MLVALLAALSGPVVAATPHARPEDALPKNAKVLKRVDADLDGDGAPERILAAGLPDPDQDPGAGRERFDGSIEVHVLLRSGAGWADAGRIELTGQLEDVVVADLGEGADRVRLLFAAAAHCGGSCSGIELHAHALRGGRLVAYLEDDELYKGFATVFPGRFVETWTREDEGTDFAECCPSAFRVTRLAPRGGKLVEVDSAHVLAEEMRSGASRPAPAPAARLTVSTRPPAPILSPEQLAARDWLVRPGVSVGKITLGMSAASVHDRLGAPAERRETAGGIAVERWGERNRVLVWLEGEKVVQIAVTSPKFKSGDGLGPGAPISRVLAEYPDDARPPLSTATRIDTFSGISFQLAPEAPGRVGAVIVYDRERDDLPLE
jgi:hypothetical protein